jgi:ribonucleoside-diphosphate reductase alpha chain
MAKSIMDYIFRWLASKFLTAGEKALAGVQVRGEAELGREVAAPAAEGAAEPPGVPAEGNGAVGMAIEPARVAFLYQQDAPSCHECGAIMVRNGACYKCLNCGSTSGCS